LLDQQGALTSYPNSIARVRVIADAASSGSVSATINGVSLSGDAVSPSINSYVAVPSGAVTGTYEINDTPISGVALANLVMVTAAWNAGTGKASWLWLFCYFVVVTIGELYLSPIGLSLVSKIAPARLLSMLMGFWLGTSFTGNFIAGWLGSFWSRMEKPEFFLMIAAIATLAGATILASRWALAGVLRE